MRHQDICTLALSGGSSLGTQRHHVLLNGMRTCHCCQKTSSEVHCCRRGLFDLREKYMVKSLLLGLQPMPEDTCTCTCSQTCKARLSAKQSHLLNLSYRYIQGRQKNSEAPKQERKMSSPASKLSRGFSGSRN